MTPCAELGGLIDVSTAIHLGERPCLYFCAITFEAGRVSLLVKKPPPVRHSQSPWVVKATQRTTFPRLTAEFRILNRPSGTLPHQAPVLSTSSTQLPPGP